MTQPQAPLPPPGMEGWYWNGKRWRPPVPQLTRWQLIQQVPGALLKLTFLVILLGFLLVFLWGMLFGK